MRHNDSFKTKIQEENWAAQQLLYLTDEWNPKYSYLWNDFLSNSHSQSQ